MVPRSVAVTPVPSVRKVVPLLVRTATVEAAKWCAAADGADGAEACELPELQAAAMAPAAASGSPSLSASGIFVEVRGLIISPARRRRFDGCARPDITVILVRKGNSLVRVNRWPASREPRAAVRRTKGYAQLRH
jgi:hypothetical protein